MTSSVIDGFTTGLGNDKLFYKHVIFMDDDRVECQRDSGEMVLKFDSVGRVSDGRNNQIGRFRMKLNDITKTHTWSFEGTDGWFNQDYGWDLLKAEMEVSKKYLQG